MKLIVHQHKFAKAENVNVDAVLLEHHSVARILMNVPNKYVTAAPCAKIHRDHLNVFAQNKRLAIHTQHRAAYCQINVYKMKIALQRWLASKVNARNHAQSPNVDAMQFVNQTNIKHSVNAHLDIWAIQLIN